MAQQQILMQVPLKTSQQVEAQLMMAQIDSIFETFQAAIRYRNSSNSTPDGMVTFNDAAVSLLDLFGAQCDEHKNEKERDILRAVYAYFLQKTKKLSSMKQQDVAVINNWLQYINNVLTSDAKSKRLQLSQETVQFAEKNLVNGLTDALSVVLGENHEARKIGKDVEENPAKFQQRNETWCKETKGAYNKARNTSQCPTQNGLYEYAGRAVQFAPPRSIGSKHVHHIPDVDLMDEDNKEEEHEHEYEQQETAPRRTVHDHARAPAQPQLQPPYHAVLWKSGKVPFPTSYGVESVQCPVPCLVFRDLGKGKVVIQLARPWNYISAECHVNELKVDKKEVAQCEADHMLRNKDVTDLGYQ